jgi:hypothetical protein
VGYRMDDGRTLVLLPVEVSDLSFFFQSAHTGSRAFLPWVLVLGHDIDHSSPSGADFKDQWCYALVSHTGTAVHLPL